MQTLNDMDFCVVDTETTGGKADDSQIIDIAVFHVRDGIVLGKYQTLINPGVPIPAWISALTGISDDMVVGAPRFEDVSDDLMAFLKKGVFVAHNVGFDYSFVKKEFERAGRTFAGDSLCTLRLARRLFPELPSRSLGPLCEHLLISVFDRHRAAGDAEATVYLLKHVLKKLEKDHSVKTWVDLEKWLGSTKDRRTRKASSSASSSALR